MIYGGDWASGTINVESIRSLPDAGPLTKTSTLIHEVVEQWIKQAEQGPEKVFDPAHEKAMDMESEVTGWSRGESSLGTGYVDIKYYRKVEKKDKDGKTTTEEETKTIRIKKSSGGGLPTVTPIP